MVRYWSDAAAGAEAACAGAWVAVPACGIARLTVTKARREQSVSILFIKLTFDPKSLLFDDGRKDMKGRRGSPTFSSSSQDNTAVLAGRLRTTMEHIDSGTIYRRNGSWCVIPRPSVTEIIWFALIPCKVSTVPLGQRISRRSACAAFSMPK